MSAEPGSSYSTSKPSNTTTSSSSSSTDLRIPIFESGDDEAEWRENLVKWEEETLETFSSKLKRWQDLNDDISAVQERNELNEDQQLSKIGITFGFDKMSVFRPDVFVTACEMGCTKALRLVIKKLLTIQNNDRKKLLSYFQAQKDVNLGLLPPEVARGHQRLSMTAIEFCFASGFLPGLRVLVEEGLDKSDVPFFFVLFESDSSFSIARKN